MPTAPAPKKVRARSVTVSALPASADSSPVVVCGSDDYIDPRMLVGLENNPRTLSPERRAALLRSIRDLGLFRPLLAWKGPEGPVVIGGCQRLPLLQELAVAGATFILRDGMRPGGVPVTWFEGTEAQARIVALRDNNSDGDWDYPKLSTYLRDLEGLEGYDPTTLTLSGFDDTLLGDLIASYTVLPVDAPPPPASPVPVVDPAVDPAVAPGPAAGAAPAPPATTPTPAPPAGAGALSDPAEQLIGVVIGHVRGKIKAPTYQRLIEELSKGMASGIPEGGLDAAVAALLSRLPA